MIVKDQKNILAGQQRTWVRATAIYLAVLLLFLLILLVVGGAVLTQTADDSAELFIRHQSARVASHFRAFITPHLVHLHQVSGSTAVAQWLADEANEYLRAVVVRELDGFFAAWPYSTLHLVVRDSRQEYAFYARDMYNELFPTKLVDAADAHDSWYFYALRSNAPYSLHINECTHMGTEESVNIMISQRVYYQGINVGVASVSIPFYALFDSLFADDDPYIQTFIIDRTGAIQVNSRTRGISTLTEIPGIGEMPELLAIFANMLMLMEGGAFPPGVTSGVAKFGSGAYSLGGVMPIAGTDWLTVTLMYGQGRFAALRQYWPLVIAAILLFGATGLVAYLTMGFRLRDAKHVLEQQAQEANIRADSTLQAVVSNYSGVIWNVDISERITIFSGLALAKYGLQPRFYEGKKLSEIPVNWINFDIVESVRSTFADGPQQRTINMGDDVYYVRTAPIFDDRGNLASVVGGVVDITESAGLHKKLEEAFSEAQLASKAKSNFLSTMSHEMRTPMNTIIGMSSIGKGASDITRKDYAFEKIEVAGIHLLSVINDVLDMSKIEAGMLSLSNEPFYLERAIEKALTVTNLRMEEKNQQFSFNVDSNVPEIIVADDHRLTQVLTNLLINAAKFTPEGKSIRLEIYLVDKQDDNCTIRFDVKDQGIGLSKEQQAKLFQPFVQAEDTTTRNYGGTGLGLAICKHIVNSMNGEIWVESELNQGATFSFIIKAGIADKKALPIIREDAKTMQKYPGRRLLIAEDIDTNREVILMMLKPSGIKVKCAKNGAEALQLFGANPESYDLIFMDVHMPIMDGFQATHAIRALAAPQAQTVPIVAMTANVFREDIERCMRAGMNDHLGKPIDLNELINKLEKYLKAPELTAIGSDLPCIDVKEGMGRLGNDRKIYKRLLESFTGPQLADELAKAVANKDRDGMVRSAHTLKGAASNLSLARIADISDHIEQRARQDEPFEDLFTLLNEAMAETIQAIKDFRPN